MLHVIRRPSTRDSDERLGVLKHDIPKVLRVSCQTKMAAILLYAPTISAADVGHVSVTFLWSMYDATTTSERYPSPGVQ